MKTLIIYAHPNDKSYNASILETVKENLSSKHELKILDLYKEKFDPVLRFDTTHRRRGNTLPQIGEVLRSDEGGKRNDISK